MLAQCEILHSLLGAGILAALKFEQPNENGHGIPVQQGTEMRKVNFDDF